MNGLEFLKHVGIVVEDELGIELAKSFQALSEDFQKRLLYERCLEVQRPPWLADADNLVRDPGDLPQDAIDVAHALEVSEREAWGAVRQVHGKIDLAERQRVGALGEVGLVRLLEESWPGSAQHVALEHDGFGYDIAVAFATSSWHLEVKTTSRRGRLVVYLSRQEYEVGLTDPSWRLVVVGLNDGGQPAAIATVDMGRVSARAPQDVTPMATWQGVRLELTPLDLAPGLSFLEQRYANEALRLLRDGTSEQKSAFAWMPTH
jgi:hypothetical protein